jgi:membrane-bound metal-dependent hydrolase YbcI (DUF457 family)
MCNLKSGFSHQLPIKLKQAKFLTKISKCHVITSAVVLRFIILSLLSINACLERWVKSSLNQQKFYFLRFRKKCAHRKLIHSLKHCKSF